MDLLLGCPVYRREFVITEHLKYADQAAQNAGFIPEYLFVGPFDDPTLPLIRYWMETNARKYYYVGFEQEERDPRRGIWTEARHAFMADLRNVLLEHVRAVQPGLFLSVDSDILLHPQAIVGALEGIGTYDAVGMKVYLTERGDECPSYANMVGGHLHRLDFAGFAPVQVIMAVKLMTPKAYGVDYVGHFQGEDIGWSLKCGEAGVRLGWDGRHVSKHIMEPYQLDEFDVRVGW